MNTITIGEALKAQPKLREHAGYRKWVSDDDDDALDEALLYWGFNPRNNEGNIPLDDE